MIWAEIFDNFGIKTVTLTDKNKEAYVVNADQRKVLQAAGIFPASARPANKFSIKIIGENIQTIDASYYEAIRSGAGRPKEARMGREFIRNWLSIGDEVVLGNIGNEIFSTRLTSNKIENHDLGIEVAMRANASVVLARASSVIGKPKKITATTDRFARNPWVIAAALNRASGVCEMPTCANKYFLKDDGNVYLEVHHVVPLAEGGDDTVANVRALCPACHRELHHGLHRHSLRANL